MRWDPAADQLLLLKILETHDISVDTTKVSAAWPRSADGQPGPTPRAIKERLGKVRELARRSGAQVPASSPSKRGRGKKAAAAKSDADPQASTPQKRKRQGSSRVKEETKVKKEPQAKEESDIKVDSSDDEDVVILHVKKESSDDEDNEFKAEQLFDYPTESSDAKNTGPMSQENDDFFEEDA